MAISPSTILIFFRKNVYRSVQNPKRLSLIQIRAFSINNGGRTKKEMSIDDDEKQQKLKEVARQVCETIRTRPKWEKTILSEFERSMLFEKNLVYEVIKNQKNGLVSFRFFNWLCSNDGFVPDDRCCNAVFDGLVQAKATKVARSFKRDMEFSPKEKSLEAYVVCLCEDGDVIEAVKEMSELKSRGYLVSLEVWNTLLKDSLRVGRTDFVLELYGEMIECGVVGDVSTVGYVISAFCKDNKLSEAHELLLQVIGSGVVPEVTIFTHLISGYCHEKKCDKVSAVLHLMIANNFLTYSLSEICLQFGVYDNLSVEEICRAPSQQMGEDIPLGHD